MIKLIVRHIVKKLKAHREKSRGKRTADKRFILTVIIDALEGE